MSINLIIFTSYFAVDIKDIKGGIGYRYVGLYANLIKFFLRKFTKSTIFWYSQDDSFLRVYNGRRWRKLNQCNMTKAMTTSVISSLKSRSYLICLLGYPYAVPSIKKIWQYFLSLFVLKIFGLGGRVKLVTDFFDPPVEAAYAFSKKKPSIMFVALLRFIDSLTLRLSNLIIVLNEIWENYVSKLYKLDRSKMIVVQNGSLLAKCLKKRKTSDSFNVLYAGSAIEEKGIHKLCEVIANLRRRGFKVELYIAGAKLMELPDFVHIVSYPWPKFVNDVLASADVCVIPYPPDSFTFRYASPAKLSDYMAAGKPVVSTNLFYTAKVIKKYNCGFVAKNWDKFEFYIEKLYNDRELAKKLGENGLRASGEFNYVLLAEKLFANLLEMFRGAKL
jgi:glycosyltransferase involved in cell wall biosynthesis